MNYDAFLSHNSSDKSVVVELAESLKQAGITVFLDRWNLNPGDPWQESLELALELSRACIVCVGPTGIGPWELEEMRVAIDQAIRIPSFKVIPVFLPGVDPNLLARLPAFLRRYHGVTFQGSVQDPEAIFQLVSSLRTPDQQPSQTNASNRRSLVCLSGPSAVGKDVLLHRMLHRLRKAGACCGYLRKYTTREPRAGEIDMNPFAYVGEAEFRNLVASGEIVCERYSYGNWYGLDATFEKGNSSAPLILVSQRLYREIAELRELAALRDVDVFAVLLTGDRRSLVARSLHRSLSQDQLNRRTAQILEDLDFLDAEPDVLSLFDLVVPNGDDLSIRGNETLIWNALISWLQENSKSSTLFAGRKLSRSSIA